jgi:hypothetical protein
MFFGIGSRVQLVRWLGRVSIAPERAVALSFSHFQLVSFGSSWSLTPRVFCFAAGQVQPLLGYHRPRVDRSVLLVSVLLSFFFTAGLSWNYDSRF